MTRRIRVIGIGSGNPDHLTVQAIDALNSCDVLFVPTKGEEKAFLASLRHDICERFITGAQPRFVHFAIPAREKQTGYEQSVLHWHQAIADIYETLLDRETGEEETIGLLVWGDPMLYDSTLRILQHLQVRARFDFDYDVIPGITSLQALCAAERIPLNRIGQPVQITTGRRLAEGWPQDVADVAVMLDGAQTYETIADPDVFIYWGAYLGTPMEITLSGRLGDVASQISRMRSEARAAHGWIMDVYLLRAPDGEPG